MDMDPPSPKPVVAATTQSKRGEGNSSASAVVAPSESKRAGDPQTSAVVASHAKSKRADSPLSDGESSPSSLKPKGRSAKAKRTRKTIREEEEKRVVLALFPTPEAKAEFKKRAGSDFDPKRALDSLSFRDLWEEFSKDPNPSTKTRGRLCDLAVRSQSKQSKSMAATLATRSGKVYDKRKREENNSNSMSSTPTGKSFKIPRITTPRESSVKQAASAAREETSDDPIMDESEYPDLTHFSEGDEDPTYADMAQEKEEVKDSPLTLYIHKGKQERLRMPRQVWNVFFEKLQERCLKLMGSKTRPPRIDFSGFYKGCGVIVPVDETSQVTTIDIIDNIKVTDHEFKAWRKGERGTTTVLTLQIPPSMTPSTYTQGMIMTNLVELNELNAGPNGEHLKGISNKHVVPGSAKRVLRFAASDTALADIIERHGKLHLGASKVTVFWKGHPLAKVSPKELGLESERADDAACQLAAAAPK